MFTIVTVLSNVSVCVWTYMNGFLIDVSSVKKRCSDKTILLYSFQVTCSSSCLLTDGLVKDLKEHREMETKIQESNKTFRSTPQQPARLIEEL